jgi:hypothetical protein
MSRAARLLLAVAIVLVDAVAFVVPLAALFLAYVILADPPWFRAFINNLSKPGNRRPS